MLVVLSSMCYAMLTLQVTSKAGQGANTLVADNGIPQQRVLHSQTVDWAKEWKRLQTGHQT